jgi:hypothetical protein
MVKSVAYVLTELGATENSPPENSADFLPLA